MWEFVSEKQSVVLKLLYVFYVFLSTISDHISLNLSVSCQLHKAWPNFVWMSNQITNQTHEENPLHLFFFPQFLHLLFLEIFLLTRFGQRMGKFFEITRHLPCTASDWKILS